jgi:hypothetical protein
MALSDTDLLQFGRKYDIPIRGIYLRDRIPHSLPQTGLYIFNLDSDKTKDGKLKKTLNVGTHWTCCYIGDFDTMYFDSFGCPAPDEVITFVKLRFPSYQYNNKIIQDLASSECGLYCIAFGLYVNTRIRKQHSASIFVIGKQFVDMFQKNTLENEKILRSFNLFIKPFVNEKMVSV